MYGRDGDRAGMGLTEVMIKILQAEQRLLHGGSRHRELLLAYDSVVERRCGLRRRGQGRLCDGIFRYVFLLQQVTDQRGCCHWCYAPYMP